MVSNIKNLQMAQMTDTLFGPDDMAVGDRFCLNGEGGSGDCWLSLDSGTLQKCDGHETLLSMPILYPF